MPNRTPSRAAQERRVRATLRDVFAIPRLRAGQARVIERVLAGTNTLAIMPTGAGKSLCYQVPALLLPGRTVVVSPLIALMKDQIESLRERGVHAVQLNSAIDSEEGRAAHAALEDGSAKIVMVTPERLADREFLAQLAQHPVSLLAIDEAHCISQWGHDFRPAFLDIGPAVQALGSPTVLALTATATDDVARDICKLLGIPAAGVVHTGSYRPNLDLRVDAVAREADKLDRAVALVRSHEGSGIVYTATVRAAQQLHDALACADESVALYHGKLAAGERTAVQEAFMNGERRVMVATNAFGLGIDKPDIRFVLHYQLPANLEAYYQEAGRAGRDGEPSTCTLLFLRADKAVQQFFLAGRYPTEEDALALYATLQQPPPPGASEWTLAELQSHIARPRSKVRVALGLLRRQKVVAMAGEEVQLLRRDLSGDDLAVLMQAYRDKRGNDREGLERMVAYAQSGQCRWRMLLEHLEGEVPFERCGQCDNCRRIAAHEKVLDEIASRPTETPHEAEAPTLARGDIVKVRRYGRGIVEEASTWEITVAFADGARRSFQPEFVDPVKRKPRPQRAPAIASLNPGISNPAA